MKGKAQSAKSKSRYVNNENSQLQGRSRTQHVGERNRANEQADRKRLGSTYL